MYSGLLKVFSLVNTSVKKTWFHVYTQAKYFCAKLGEKSPLFSGRIKCCVFFPDTNIVRNTSVCRHPKIHGSCVMRSYRLEWSAAEKAQTRMSKVLGSRIKSNQRSSPRYHHHHHHLRSISRLQQYLRSITD